MSLLKHHPLIFQPLPLLFSLGADAELDLDLHL
jgi:hypothetical protein